MISTFHGTPLARWQGVCHILYAISIEYSSELLRKISKLSTKILTRDLVTKDNPSLNPRSPYLIIESPLGSSRLFKND